MIRLIEVVPKTEDHVHLPLGGEMVSLILELGIPDYADDPRFCTVPDRNKHRIELAGIIAEQMRKKPREHWLTELPKAGVPCSGLNTIDKVFEEPQVIARGMKIEAPHPLSGTAPGVANPIKFSEAVMEYRRSAPLLGEHTDEVLREVLGKDEAAIAALRKAGAL